MDDIRQRPIAQEVHEAISAVGVAIFGVSIGRRYDKSTWRIDYASEPTDEDRARVAEAIASIDITNEVAAHAEGRL